MNIHFAKKRKNQNKPWTLKPEDRFSPGDVIITYGSLLQGTVIIQYNIKEEITQFIEEGNQAEVEDAFIEAYPSMLPSFSSGFESFNQVEDTDYEKYKIDGHKSPSTIFSGKMSGLGMAGWMVTTMISDKRTVIFVESYLYHFISCCCCILLCAAIVFLIQSSISSFEHWP